jgi:molecular chaperone GrpE
MSEPAPPVVAGNVVGDGQEALTPEAIEAVLADFRSWLHQLASTPVTPASIQPEPEPIDLHTLLGQFIALRHEVNLQTRATRTQQEQNNETLQQLRQALEALRQSQAVAQRAAQQDEDEILRPLLKTLVDVYDALSLGGREVQRVRETLLSSLSQISAPPPLTPPEPAPRTQPSPEGSPRRSFWTRWFGADAAGEPQVPVPLTEPPQVLSAPREAQTSTVPVAERVRQLFDSVLTGYTMSLQRIERTLQQAGLEPIPCVGRPFNPEEMEVVAAVEGSGRPAGEVLEEVRRGYLWRERVFRYAQVSVARS